MADLKYSEAAAKLPDHLPQDTDIIGLVDPTQSGEDQMQGCTLKQIKDYANNPAPEATFSVDFTSGNLDPVGTNPVGSATFTRTGDGRTITDFEGIVRNINPGEPGFNGMRHVLNFIDLDDLINRSGSPLSITDNIADPFGGTDAKNVTIASSITAGGWNVSDASVADGTTIYDSCWVRFAGGDATAADALLEMNSGTQVDFTDILSDVVNAAGAWVRVGATATVDFGLGKRAGFRFGQTDVGSGWMSFDFYGFLSENTTGQALQVPSAYQPVSAGSQYFTTFNANSVTGNVVTDADSTIPLSGDMGATFFDTNTNYFLNSDAPVSQPSMVTGGAIEHCIAITGDYTVTVDAVGVVDGDTFTPGATANVQITGGTTGTINITEGTHKSAYIPTGATPVTRDADLLDYDAGNYTSRAGGLFAEFMYSENLDELRMLISVQGDETSAGNTRIQIDDSNTVTGAGGYGNDMVVIGTTPSVGLNKVYFCYELDNNYMAINGVLYNSAVPGQGADPADITRICVGRRNVISVEDSRLYADAIKKVSIMRVLTREEAVEFTKVP